MSEKKKVEMMLKENTKAFRENEKMLFEIKFEEIVHSFFCINNSIFDFRPKSCLVV